MKRSDMLKNIVDVLFYGSLAARVDNDSVFVTELAEKDANEVLDLMEKLGMLPPYIQETCQTHVVIPDWGESQLLKTADSTVFISRWEEE